MTDDFETMCAQFKREQRLVDPSDPIARCDHYAKWCMRFFDLASDQHFEMLDAQQMLARIRADFPILQEQAE